MIQAKIVAGSKNPFNDKKLVTFQLRYPRIIHAEIMTHAMLVKNSSSSRAIPFSKKVEAVENDPFIPIAWQKDHKGMQGTEYITDKPSLESVEVEWLEARNSMVRAASDLHRESYGNFSVTKQLCNRLLEPFEYIDVVISGTEWENFFSLRCGQYRLPDETITYRSRKDLINAQNEDSKHYIKDWSDMDWRDTSLVINESQAEIHIQALAELMWDAYNKYDYQMLTPNDWHIPFSDQISFNGNEVDDCIGRKEKVFKPFEYNRLFAIESKVKVATAICARGSYGKFEGKTVEDDIKLHDRLLLEKHMSPFSHCAKCPTHDEYEKYSDTKYVGADKPRELGWFSQFHGFMSYRYQFERGLI